MRPPREIEELRLKLHLQNLARDAEQRRLMECLDRVQEFETVGAQLLQATHNESYTNARRKLYELVFREHDGPPLLDIDRSDWGFRRSFSGPPGYELPNTPTHTIRHDSMLPPSSGRSVYTSRARDVSGIPCDDRELTPSLPSSVGDDSSALATCPSSKQNYCLQNEPGEYLYDSAPAGRARPSFSALRRSVSLIAHRPLGRQGSLRRVLHKLF